MLATYNVPDVPSRGTSVVVFYTFSKKKLNGKMCQLGRRRTSAGIRINASSAAWYKPEDQHGAVVSSGHLHVNLLFNGLSKKAVERIKNSAPDKKCTLHGLACLMFFQAWCTRVEGRVKLEGWTAICAEMKN
jgi:hypothetical protein